MCSKEPFKPLTTLRATCATAIAGRTETTHERASWRDYHEQAHGVVTGGKWIKRAQVIGAQVKQFSAGEAR